MISSSDIEIDGTTTGENGLDTGSLTNDNFYDVYIIGKADGTTAGLLVLRAGSPVMPTGYIYKRLLLTVRYDTATFREIETVGQGNERTVKYNMTIIVNGLASSKWQTYDNSANVPSNAAEQLLNQTIITSGSDAGIRPYGSSHSMGIIFGNIGNVMEWIPLINGDQRFEWGLNSGSAAIFIWVSGYRQYV
jgi:hypothetical protein